MPWGGPDEAVGSKLEKEKGSINGRLRADSGLSYICCQSGAGCRWRRVSVWLSQSRAPLIMQMTVDTDNANDGSKTLIMQMTVDGRLGAVCGSGQRCGLRAQVASLYTSNPRWSPVSDGNCLGGQQFKNSNAVIGLQSTQDR